LANVSCAKGEERKKSRAEMMAASASAAVASETWQMVLPS
jgi:hypothetical protein